MNASQRVLQARMILSVGLLVAIAVALVAAVWGIFYAILGLIAPPSPFVAALLTIGLFGSVALVESRQLRAVERATNGTDVSPNDYPELRATTTRVASMLDVPTPAIEVADSRVPERWSSACVPIRPALSSRRERFRRRNGDSRRWRNSSAGIGGAASAPSPRRAPERRLETPLGAAAVSRVPARTRRIASRGSRTADHRFTSGADCQPTRA